MRNPGPRPGGTLPCLHCRPRRPLRHRSHRPLRSVLRRWPPRHCHCRRPPNHRHQLRSHHPWRSLRLRPRSHLRRRSLTGQRCQPRHRPAASALPRTPLAATREKMLWTSRYSSASGVPLAKSALFGIFPASHRRAGTPRGGVAHRLAHRPENARTRCELKSSSSPRMPRSILYAAAAGRLTCPVLTPPDAPPVCEDVTQVRHRLRRPRSGTVRELEVRGRISSAQSNTPPRARATHSSASASRCR